MSAYLDAVAARPVIFDGAIGTNIQLCELGADDFGGASLEGCNEVLVQTRPDVIAQIHESFLAVGVDAIETDTFGAFSLVLAEYGIADRAYDLNVAAARLARDAADRFSSGDRPRFVAGSMGPGTRLPSLGQVPFVLLRDAYEEQARGLLDGGVDLLLIETVYDLLQAKAAIIASRRAMAAVGREVPIQVQVTIELTGRMLPGSEVGAALTALDALRPDVIGLNCATGPSEMGEHLRYLAAHARTPISCLPNAGLPSVVDGKMFYDLTPSSLAEHLRHFVGDIGVSVVGGCCGTTPEHLAAVVEACAHLTPARREVVFEPGAASMYTAVPFAQQTSYLAIGERANANGSRTFREAMLGQDWDTCVEVAKEQVREGSHLLDVCVDFAGANGVADMSELVGRLATQSSLPLVLDSTEAEVIEAGLQLIGGRPVLNSVNLEEGDAPGTRLDRFLALAREYGAAVICTCIDTEGQARTAAWKLRAARAIVDLAVNRYGLEPEDLLIDPLTLPLSTGLEESRRDGIETIEAIRLIKSEMPGVRTVIGLSNVSFGLKAAGRVALNSVFLHECVEAGLDAAILHSGRISALNRIDEDVRTACLDIVYDRRREGYDPLQELLRLTEGASIDPVARREERVGWSVEQRLAARIVDGDRLGLEADLEEALASGTRALTVVNDVLLPAMKEVGDLFATGEMQLPFVLQSAETMKTAVAYLEPHMERTGERGKGTVVLATVRGDVHDIGKNLVDIILTNNGYTVHNLGIKVPVNEMIQKAAEVHADAIGMSGLLVKSTFVMRENLEELNDRGIAGSTPVLLGGAALTRTYVERDLRSIYEGRLFYGRDAFEGLRTMDHLMTLRDRPDDEPDFGRALGGRNLPARAKKVIAPGDIPDRSPEVVGDNPIFTPPFFGAQIARGISLDAIARYVNETALFRNQWGFRPEKGENDADFKTRVRATLRVQLDHAKSIGVLIPQVAWGYFPVNSEGNDLIVWTDASRGSERMRFSFPRQPEHPYLCISDFFRSYDTDEIDVVAFHIVTMGPEVSKEAARLFDENRYQDYLFLHGLGVEMTEALAEYWHRRIREEWGFANEDGPSIAGLFRQQYRGGRYSFGYPACPDLEDNQKVAELLDAAQIGVTVSEEFQLEPEQSTSALIAHHPRAKYFVARATPSVDAAEAS